MTPICRIVLGLACVASCSDDAPAGFVTEHLIVEPTDSDVVCRGTLDNLEAQLVRVAAALDVEVLAPIEVYYGPSAVVEHCTSIPGVHVGGCTKGFGAEIVVASEFSSLYHEIVHAVRRSNGMRGPSFFEEGIAEVLGAFRPLAFRVTANAEQIPTARGPAALVRSPDTYIGPDEYGIAAHFMAWLIATQGQETVAAFLKDTRLADAADEAFADHFAVSLDDAELDWRATSDSQYTLGDVCDPARGLAWSGDALEYSAQLACDAPHVIGPAPDHITIRSACFPIEQAGLVNVRLVAASGELTLRHQGDCVPVGPLSAEHYQDKRMAAGDTIDAPFAPCTWEVIVTTTLASPTDFTLRLSR